MSFQTPGGPAAKRRRIETANATLRKPFRSPLIARNEDDSQTLSPSIGRGFTPAASTATPGTPAPAPRGNRRPTNTAVSPLATTSPALSVVNYSPPSRKRPETKTGEDYCHDGDLLSRISASQRQLASQLRAAQAQLDLVRQARRIEQASSAAKQSGTNGEEGVGSDAGLREMISRWKAASRLAAEDLFELVKGRVEGAGGVRAWKARQQEVCDIGVGFGDGERRDGKGDGDGEMQGKSGRERDDGSEDGKDDEETVS
ncbi:hypothetical protein N657DRAFT_639154 [Parathielavia appendiculata]|uniref:Swi5-dependent recombination DNA repair protein 1 n=1 Tax=Parathielavia appendiculata TaxID=2587402 RepID=A0AAN6U932_9PEZI|nr:hypothetical protein N657DRAFT_639154 [Parathielavia appendiculata]